MYVRPALSPAIRSRPDGSTAAAQIRVSAEKPASTVARGKIPHPEPPVVAALTEPSATLLTIKRGPAPTTRVGRRSGSMPDIMWESLDSDETVG
jgi:hypothetical protein